MDRTIEFGFERFVNHSLAGDAAHSLKGRRDHDDAKMCLAFGPGAGMAFMTIGLINNFKAFRGKSLGELGFDALGNCHGKEVLADPS